MLNSQRPLYRPVFTGIFALAALVGLAAPAHAGVSLSIGEPGFYGRIDIGGRPPPPVIYSHPIIVAPAPVMGPPVYLRVPPRHMRHWNRHCHYYGACDEQVYFVRDSWYRREFAPPPPPPLPRHVRPRRDFGPPPPHDGYGRHGYRVHGYRYY